MICRAVYVPDDPPVTVKGTVLVANDLSGFAATTTMAAVPWLAPVTTPGGVAGLSVAQDAPAATAGATQVEQVAPVEPLGHRDIVHDRAVRPVGQVVVTVATDVSLELQVVVMAGLPRPAVTSCVVGAAEKVPIASSWLD